MNHKKLKLVAIVLAILIAVSAVGVGIYAADYYHMDSVAAAAMSEATRSKNLTVFSADASDTGFIFYPGGKVEATAYAPLMSALAAEGITCIIAEMPMNLAVLDMDAAAGIPEQFPEITNWYIGGHSLGGSMAASYAADAEYLAGLILLAAYSTADLNDTGLDVLSIYGTHDKVLNMEKYAQYLPNLPKDALELVIEGGNHAQFGSYGAQDGDGEAAISPEAQLEQTAAAIADFMK